MTTETMTLRERLIKKGREQAKPEELTLFGEKVELRRPSVGTILSLQDDAASGTNQMMATTIIMTVYDPVTNQPLFTEEDRTEILAWAFDADVQELVNRLTAMVGLNIKEAEKN